MYTNDTNRTIRPFLVAFLLTAAGFYLGSVQLANAQLPVKAGLGQVCSATVPCESQFFCSGGKCVQCVDDSVCHVALNESCSNYVCTLPGGNNAGDLCADTGNCKSGLKCGTRGICEAVGGFKKAFNYSCQSTPDCAEGLLCGPDSKRCVECFGFNNCDTSRGEVSACDSGVCVYKGGNEEGAWCNKDAHCISGKCSDGNLCLAAEEVTGEGGGGGWDWTGINLTIQDVADIINGLACWLTRIATAIMVIFLVIAGMRFMYARGNPTAYQEAVKNFKHVLIGILVIMAVYVIIATVAHAVGRTDFSLIPLVC